MTAVLRREGGPSDQRTALLRPAGAAPSRRDWHLRALGPVRPPVERAGLARRTGSERGGPGLSRRETCGCVRQTAISSGGTTPRVHPALSWPRPAGSSRGEVAPTFHGVALSGGRIASFRRRTAVLRWSGPEDRPREPLLARRAALLARSTAPIASGRPRFGRIIASLGRTIASLGRTIRGLARTAVPLAQGDAVIGGGSGGLAARTAVFPVP
jgi:hypothetical protein